MATATKAAVQLVSLEEYLSTVYEPDAEFVDGVVEQRAMGEDDHSSWQAPFQDISWRERSSGACVSDRSFGTGSRTADTASPMSLSSMETRLNSRSPSTRRWLSLRFSAHEDRHKRLIVRLAGFERMGVRSIYTIDPEDGLMLRFEGGVLAPATRISIPFQGIDLALTEIASLVR